MKIFVAHLMLLASITSPVQADEPGAKSTVSALYTLAGIKRTYADAQASYHFGTRAIPKTPAGSKEREQFSKQFEEKQANLFMKALELAKANPRSTAGFAALEWILINPDCYDLPSSTPALELMAQHYSEHPNIGYVIANLAFYLPQEDALSRQPSINLLNKVAARNPDRTARGQAALGLATIAKENFKHAENMEKSNVDRLAKQAEEAFELVVRDYESCLYLRTVGIRPAKSTLGEEAKSDLAELRFLRIGQDAPEIQGEDLLGTKFRLSDYRGKVVLLVFWASWCGPCIADVPHEKELIKRFSGRPFMLIGVNGDSSKTNALKAVSEHQIPWRSFSDERRTPDRLISVDWNVRAWPEVFVLDHKGVIRHKSLRGERLDDPLEKLVSAAEASQRSSK